MEPNFDEYLTRVAGDSGDKYRCRYCQYIFYTEDEMVQHNHRMVPHSRRLAPLCKNAMLKEYSEEQAALLRRSFSEEQALLGGSFSEEPPRYLRLWFSGEQAALLMAFVSNELLRRSFSEEQAALFRRSTTAALVSHPIFHEQRACLSLAFSDEQAALLEEQAELLERSFSDRALLFRRLSYERQVALLRRSFSEEQAALFRCAISKEEMEVDFDKYVIQVARNCGISYRCLLCDEAYSVEGEMVRHLREAHTIEMRNSFSEEQEVLRVMFF